MRYASRVIATSPQSIIKKSNSPPCPSKNSPQLFSFEKKKKNFPPPSLPPVFVIEPLAIIADIYARRSVALKKKEASPRGGKFIMKL